MKNGAVWKELNIGSIANTSTIKKMMVKKSDISSQCLLNEIPKHIINK